MASTASRLTVQDRKDLEKFTKYLVYKCIQVIVQGRLGEKMQTLSSPFSSSSDWFNLDINDIPEVLNETKKVFAGLVGGSLNVGQNICIEISLHTVEGESMILETWWMTLTDTIDPSARVSYTVYNRMGTLLKSLICATRVVPAYRLSRKQGSETFVVCYRIYTGEPQFHLGVGHQKTRVGSVPTPTGTIVLSVAYRTKMLMSPQTSLHREMPFELKDDHFMEGSPRKKQHEMPIPCMLKERHRRLSGDEGLIFAADPPDPCECVEHCCCGQNSFSNGDLANRVRYGAFAPHQEHPTWSEDDSSDDVPFMKLLVQGDRLNANDDQRSGSQPMTTESKPTAPNTNCDTTDDYVMIQLKTPFAGTEGASELNGFYRECQGAPPLSMLSDKSSVQDTLNCITQQLAEFETHAKDFDDFVNSIKVAADA
ncbi:hypothetical protein CAPTEDRAFT_175434 [Capitella teleta]|uniref:Autophagy-related protein 13 n=1 Tax=Capitella teleta TaxID=283909 RepID=R7UM48_CAPTE|nr:hypothetical protein CAPTEDRAFT_175434 [Capitella teleta]|eukprot:ELU07579.1 hypothetical protein CAPTEDRAFT_175434 [Capitella teleta]